MYRSVKGLSGFALLGILLAFLGLGFILAGIAQLMIGLQIMPKGASISDADALVNAMLDPRNVTFSRISQVLGTFFLFFIPAILFSLVANGKNLFWLGFNRYFSGSQIVIAFFIILAASIAFGPLADMSREIVSNFPKLDKLAHFLEDQYNKQVRVLSNLQSWPEYITAIAIMAFFPALFEEVFFRGALQNFFHRWWNNPWIAIIVISVIFSIFHSSVYLFATRFALGCMLGVLYYFTRNIWVNVIAHFLNNAVALTQMFVLSKQKKIVEADKLDPQLHWIWSIVALFVLFLLFRQLRKISAEYRRTIETKEIQLAQSSRSNPFE